MLSVLPKPPQKHINRHVITHFNSNNLLHPNQSGFRKQNHSCHTAITSLTGQWLSNINNNQFCGALFVDFAKAVDVIDHDLLLRKFALYGLSPATITLLTSFLTNREQFVHVNATKGLIVFAMAESHKVDP